MACGCISEMCELHVRTIVSHDEGPMLPCSPNRPEMIDDDDDGLMLLLTPYIVARIIFDPVSAFKSLLDKSKGQRSATKDRRLLVFQQERFRRVKSTIWSWYYCNIHVPPSSSYQSGRIWIFFSILRIWRGTSSREKRAFEVCLWSWPYLPIVDRYIGTVVCN